MKKVIILSLTIIFLLTGCGKSSPVASSLPTSATNVPPTAIYIPPSATFLPPTQTVTSASSAVFTLTPTILPTLTASGDGVLAFASLQNSNVQICLINADGSEQIRLTDGTSGGVEPSWSPDGKKLVF